MSYLFESFSDFVENLKENSQKPKKGDFENISDYYKSLNKWRFGTTIGDIKVNYRPSPKYGKIKKVYISKKDDKFRWYGEFPKGGSSESGFISKDEMEKTLLDMGANKGRIKKLLETNIDEKQTDPDLMAKLEDESYEKAAECPRCGKLEDECICQERDVFSTVNAFRASKGDKKKKDEFKS